MITQNQLCASIAHAVDNINKKVKFVKNIFKDIHDHGGKVLLVGGAVRDIVLEKPWAHIQDLDFEIYGISLDQLTMILEKYGIVNFVGKSFGVLRLHGLDIDWSLPRKDSIGRKPHVEFNPHMSYQDAFARRDLTMNAMGIDMMTQEFIDPYHGFDDLHHKILRSPHLDFFSQDPLRLLRVMQFIGRFDMHVDENLSKVCGTMNVDQIARERIEQEFEKLFLKSTYPSQGLKWLESIHQWDQFLPVVRDKETLYVAVDFLAQAQFSTAEEKLAAMWFLCMMCSEFCAQKQSQGSCKNFVKKYILEIDRQQKIITYIMQFEYALSVKNLAQVKWLAYYLGMHGSVHILCILLHSMGYKEQAERIHDFAMQANVLYHAEPALLQGKDLQHAAQGKALGLLLEKAYQIQVQENIHSKKSLLDRLAQEDLL